MPMNWHGLPGLEVSLLPITRNDVRLRLIGAIGW